MGRLACLLIGYACGCVLAADIVARVQAGTSAFAMGDGNPGMANVGRELGRGAALACLAGDIAKTVVAVIGGHLLAGSLNAALATAWSGLGATLGHMFPFWHRFRGGKGVTTISSTIILVAPVWGILAGVVATVGIVASGHLSVGAICGITFYAVAMAITGTPEIAAITVVFLLLELYAHASKLAGIRTGATRRAGLAQAVRKRLHRK